jgi:hypothetical protein
VKRIFAFIAAAVVSHDRNLDRVLDFFKKPWNAHNTIPWDVMVLNRQPFRATYKGVLGEWEFQGCDASDFEAIFVPDKKTISPRPLMKLKRGAPIIINPVSSHTLTVFKCDSSC